MDGEYGMRRNCISGRKSMRRKNAFGYIWVSDKDVVWMIRDKNGKQTGFEWSRLSVQEVWSFFMLKFLSVSVSLLAEECESGFLVWNSSGKPMRNVLWKVWGWDLFWRITLVIGWGEDRGQCNGRDEIEWIRREDGGAQEVCVLKIIRVLLTNIGDWLKTNKFISS